MLENAVLNPIHEKTTILITEPLKTPLHKTNLNIETQRIRLRNKLRELANKRNKNGQKTFFIEHDTQIHDRSSFDEKNHLNETGIHHLLDEIDRHHNIRLNKGPDTKYTTDRFYSGVTPIAKMGCHYCCDKDHVTIDCTSEEAFKRMQTDYAFGQQKTRALEILHNLQNQPLRTPYTSRTNETNTTNPNKQPPTKPNEQTTNKPNATKINTTGKTDKNEPHESTTKTDKNKPNESTTTTTKTRDKRLLSDESTKTDRPASKQQCGFYEITDEDLKEMASQRDQPQNTE